MADKDSENRTLIANLRREIAEFDGDESERLAMVSILEMFEKLCHSAGGRK